MFFWFKDKFPHLKEQWSSYLAMHQRLEVPARTILLHEGEISKRSFLIEKGCVRVWFNNNGKDTSFQFFFENEGLASLESFRHNIPSMFTIETMEPCVIHTLHKSDYEKIMLDLEKDPEFLKQVNNVLFERQLHYVREFLSFIRDTPQQRYANLLKYKPQIIQRVPQHYIASYLGVSTVHLSRIKSKLLKENKG